MPDADPRPSLGRRLAAWAASQVLTGVEAGMLAAALVLGLDMSLSRALPVAFLACLPLLPLQARWLARRQPPA